MHVSILESGDGGTIKENIARGGIFMRDQEITELFWERKELKQYLSERGYNL